MQKPPKTSCKIYYNESKTPFVVGWLDVCTEYIICRKPFSYGFSWLNIKTDVVIHAQLYREICMQAHYMRAKNECLEYLVENMSTGYEMEL